MKKKIFAILMAVMMMVTFIPTMAFAEGEENVAKIGEQTYPTLQEAVNAVSSDDTTTITLLKDCKSVGITISSGKNLIIDFGGHTAEFERPGAGSPSTQTQAFQLLKNSIIEFKNGTIKCTDDNKGAVNDGNNKPIKMLVQNYSNLTLDKMTLDGTNLAASNVGYYTLSNCNEIVKIKDTKIIAHETVEDPGQGMKGDAFAFDVDYKEDKYPDGTKVTVEGTSDIVGNIEVKQNQEKSTLTVKSGTFTDLATAVKYADNDATIKLGENVALNQQLEINKAITIDGNEKIITSNINQSTAANKAAGILLWNDVTLKNLKVVGPNQDVDEQSKIKWKSGYITIKAYDGQSTLENVELTRGSEALQVSGANTNVTLKGTQNYNGNVYNGIEVKENGTLIVDAGTVFTDKNESVVWIDAGGSGTVTDNTNILKKTGESPSKQQWAVAQYVVKFNANGGTTTPANQSIYASHKATAPSVAKTGYKLVGWYTTDTFTDGTKWNFDTNIVTANTTLYAKWEPIKYWVSFNNNGGAGTMANQQMTYDTAVNLTSNSFTRDGYVFNGWNTAANGLGTSYANGASVINLSSTEGAKVDLYAQWKSQTTTGGEDANVDATEEVKITGNTAKVSLDANDIKNIMKAVDTAKSTTLTINAVSTEKAAEKVTTSQLEVPTSFLKTVGSYTSTVENLEVKTNVGTLEFDKDALASIADQAETARGTTLTIEIKKVAQKTGEIDQDYELTVKSNNVVIKNFEGGKETVTVPIPSSLRGKTVSCMYVENNEVVEGVEKISQTTSAFTFKTGHNSLYRLTTAENAKKHIKPLVNDATVYQRKLTAYKNGKIKISWNDAKGYEVDRYQIWRATKKNGKYKKLKVVTDGSLTHINTKNLKKGQKYYYKVRGSVKMDDGTWAYTEYSNIRYAKCKKTR